MKILIVDDGVDDRRLLRFYLSSRGHEVIEAGGGGEAIELAVSERPDLIISDAMMPGMDGFQLLSRLKADDALSRIPFVFYSAVYTGKNEEELALSMGALAFIKKPKDINEFWVELGLVMSELDKAGEAMFGLDNRGPDNDISREYFLQRYGEVVASRLADTVKRLKLAQNKYEAAFEATGDFVSIHNRERKIVRANRAMHEAFGVMPGGLAGKTCHELIHGRSDPCENCPLEPALRYGVSSSVEIEGQGGKTFFISVAPILNEDGATTEFIHIARDITGQKSLEEQLRRAQRLEAIGLLAGGVAHDFNNILTSIQGYTELAMMKAGRGSPICNDLSHVDMAVEKAADLVRQLLLFSRKQSVVFKVMDVNKAVDGLMKMLERLIGENIRLHVLLDPETKPVNGDPGNIEQVIMNLVLNAKDALPDGGDIFIETGNAGPDVSIPSPALQVDSGGYVRLSVKDNGVGMDKDVMKHIFEPFFTTKELGKGTGLGLAVVYGIVSRHGGWVDVFSRPGEGSTFTVYLPAASETDGKIKECGLPPGGSGAHGGIKGVKVLLVEDDPDVREFISLALGEYGYSVFAAGCASEAMDIFDREDGGFDLVLSDVILPDKGGVELVHEIRLRRPGLKFLFISGYAGSGSIWKAIKASGFPFLQKPFTIKGLLGAVRELME